MSRVSAAIEHTRAPTAERDGPVYVTRRCLGMGICRNIAPELFGGVPAGSDPTAAASSRSPGSYEAGSYTGVLRQPRDDGDLADAQTAAQHCPMAAIRIAPHTRPSFKGESRPAPRRWPQRLEDNVGDVRHPAEKNFAATVYFVEQPGGGRSYRSA